MNLQKAPDSNSSLALAVRPQGGLGYQLALVVGGSLLVALAAQVEIPMWPVPVK